jgi:hypothetical protein
MDCSDLAMPTDDEHDYTEEGLCYLQDWDNGIRCDSHPNGSCMYFHVHGRILHLDFLRSPLDSIGYPVPCKNCSCNRLQQTESGEDHHKAVLDLRRMNDLPMLSATCHQTVAQKLQDAQDDVPNAAANDDSQVPLVENRRNGGDGRVLQMHCMMDVIHKGGVVGSILA